MSYIILCAGLTGVSVCVGLLESISFVIVLSVCENYANTFEQAGIYDTGPNIVNEL